MATVEDVKPGSRWRSNKTLPGPLGSGPFHPDAEIQVDTVDQDRVMYHYTDGRRSVEWRSRRTFVRYAQLVAPCVPGCNPANPCLLGSTCGGLRPEYTGRDGFIAWELGQCRVESTAVRDRLFPPFGEAATNRRTLNDAIGGPLYLRDGKLVLGYRPSGPEPMRNGSGALACDWIQRRR